MAENGSRLTLIDWRAYNRNTLRGFAAVALPNHLVIHDLTVHVKNGRWWIGLPSQPQLQDGQIIKDDAGKAKYKRILEWNDRDIGDRFSDAVISLIRAKHDLVE